MMSVEDVNTGALMKDAARLAKHDEAFKADFDRFVISGAGWRASFAWTILVLASDEKRPVPWAGDEIIAEIRRRKAEKAAR